MSDLLRSSAWQARVERSMTAVRKVLSTTRSPRLAEDVHHEYGDKFLLAQAMTEQAVTLLVQALLQMGAGGADVAALCEAAQTRTVTLRFAAPSQKAVLKKKVVREEASKVKHVTEVKGGLLGDRKVTDTTLRTITEWLWDCQAEYEIRAYVGGDPEDTKKVVAAGVRTAVKTTGSDAAPSHAAREHEVNITWLLQHWNPLLQKGRFAIDRGAAGCHTPRRNGDVDAALQSCAGVGAWAGQVGGALASLFGDLDAEQTRNGSDVPIAILPMLDPPLSGGAPAIEQAGAAEPTGHAVLSPADAAELLSATAVQLQTRLDAAASAAPSGADAFSTAAEARVLVLLGHIAAVAKHLRECVDYLEGLLHSQVVGAVGKELTADDFREYMEFHCRKLFAAAYAPAPFCYAVRRPNSNPEGTVSIEATGAAPVPMLTRHYPPSSARPFQFALNASTTLRFNGETFVHAHLGHRFSTEPQEQVEFVARARQFSGYVVVLGRVTAADELEPKHAFYVQNKDEVRMPLWVERVPGAGADFEAALASLSPEQARFCRAYREMQLEHTVFGVCVVQTKPQLEAVLNLPPHALDKEIRLSQELLSLFTEFHIPSDSLSYQAPARAHVDPHDPATSVTGEAKVAAVKANLAAVQDHIHGTGMRAVASEAKENVGKTRVDECAYWHRPSNVGSNGGGAPPPEAAAAAAAPDHLDATRLPRVLEAAYAAASGDGCVQPAVLHCGSLWQKAYQKQLLQAPGRAFLGEAEQAKEKQRAWDLLSSLTRCGALPLVDASLHIIVSATHAFDRTLMATVIEENVNPIERVERSLLSAAAAVHGVPAAELIHPAHVDRVRDASPALFIQV
eukprot:TRINITY_DN17327_c0_g2_i1.p1 TRINITY_DN17327_c0_g2~~TRINITY_DN17327_c0_g2_i1.p1  ORF type:complete len:869 (+),score=301.22 TRINITY_DN17327_c0_g2_i1:62-2608(+)